MTVNWSKDGIRVREGLGASITTESAKSTLTLEEVDSDDDECSVQCDLRNSEGKASSQAKIKILCPPKISCPSSYKDGLTYDEGDNLRLKASFTGKPTPVVRWLFNDEEPSLDDRVEISRQASSMEVRICEVKQTDAGSYEFVAENVMGKDAVSIKVTITGPPSSPSGSPFIEVISEDECLLKWNIPLQDGGSSVFNYIVEIKKNESDEWQRFATVRDTCLEITNISELEKSVFRIRAVNIYGTSEPSDQYILSNGLIDGLDITADRTLLPESECPLLQKAADKEAQPDSTRDITHLTYQPDLVNIGEIFSEEKAVGKISRQVSFAESHELEPECTLTIMYVGTQTFISVPILNYACSDVYDFEEITHFAAEVLPSKEYAIQNIDNILCYTICWFTTVLECCSRHILLDKSASVSDYTINSYDCSLKNYVISGYDFVSGEYIWNCWSLKDIAHFIEEHLEIIDVKELVCSNICLALTDLDCAKVSTHTSYKETIFMSLPPLVFESLLPFIADTVFKHNLAVNYQLHNSITVFEALFLHRTAIHEVKDEIKRAISVTHISEEFETLAGSKCVPMTSFKPALSVLPMSRTAITEPKQKNEVSREADFSVQSEKKLFKLCSLPRQTSRSSFDKIIDASDACIKCGLTDTCLCSILDDEISISNEIDTYGIRVNRIELPSTSETVTKGKGHSSVFGFTENIPDWLRFVSPLYLCNQETTNGNALDLDDLKPPSRNLTAESDISKSYLKDRSVQELLNLAEEVERSFSEKAEHIESLENILHEEITSLEKDLEAVHEIHRTFWNQSLVPWINPDPLNEQVTETSEGNKTIETDLIDFKMDVPSVKIQKEKQEEYAPQIITHLQNRVVQCGNRTRLYCSISGKPDPQIAWLKNGKLLSQNCRYVISNLVEFGLYIDIFNSKSTDSGEYMCIATNCHGSAQTSAYVRVIGHREYSPEEPKFVSSPDDVNVAEGDTVTLDWKVSGTPVPHVMWFKNTEKIETGLRIDTLSNHRGCCRIVLHDVMPDDAAIYTCYLENEAGSSVSTVVVKVSDGPKVPERAEGVDSMLKDLLSPAGDSNIPNLKYYERLLSDRGISPFYEKSRKRSRRSKKGTRDVPGPPFAPRILNSGKTWIILSWSAPTNRIGNTSDVLYLVERRLLEEEQWKEVARTYHSLLTVAGLKSGQSYVFRIWAGNKNGWGPPAMLTQPAHCEQNVTEKTKYTIM